MNKRSIVVFLLGMATGSFVNLFLGWTVVAIISMVLIIVGLSMIGNLIMIQRRLDKE